MSLVVGVVCTNEQLYRNIDTHIYKYVCMYVYVYVDIYIYICMCVYTYNMCVCVCQVLSCTPSMAGFSERPTRRLPPAGAKLRFIHEVRYSYHRAAGKSHEEATRLEPCVGVQPSGAVIQTPNSMAHVLRTPTIKTLNLQKRSNSRSPSPKGLKSPHTAYEEPLY